MEKARGYKYWLNTYESTVYCGEDCVEAHKFLKSVVHKIMETKFCTMLDLIDLDCDIHRSGVKQVGYSTVHGWTEAQIQQMYVGTDTLGHFVWLGPPVSLTDETEEKTERSYCLSYNATFISAGYYRTNALKLLNQIDDCIRMYKICTIYDLSAFDVDTYAAQCNLGWKIIDNLGWTENQLPGMGVEELPTGTYIVKLGKPVDLAIYEEEDELEMKITEVVQQPERPHPHCYECKYFKALVDQYPCCNCTEHSEFVPAKKENKGEKVMNHYEEDLTKIDRNSIIPKRIWFNEHDGMFYTTVEWEDGAKTTVSEENKEHASQYGGFTAALAKRMFGTGNSIYLMNRAIDKANEKKKLREQKREEERRLKQQKRELEAERRKEEHEARVREEIEKLQVEQEAQKRFRDVRFQAFARALLGLNAKKVCYDSLPNSNDKTAKEEDHAE